MRVAGFEYRGADSIKQHATCNPQPKTLNKLYPRPLIADNSKKLLFYFSVTTLKDEVGYLTVMAF